MLRCRHSDVNPPLASALENPRAPSVNSATETDTRIRLSRGEAPGGSYRTQEAARRLLTRARRRGPGLAPAPASLSLGLHLSFPRLDAVE